MQFARLHGVALSDTPKVEVKLVFAMLDQRPVLHGQLHAEVELMCQRCMGNMQYPVAEQFELMLVAGNAELDLVPEPYEPWVANALRLNVFDLVEEQLLLALPLIAKHTDAHDCVRIDASLSTMLPSESSVQAQKKVAPHADEVQRPFGNLRDLLRK